MKNYYFLAQQHKKNSLQQRTLFSANLKQHIFWRSKAANTGNWA